MALSIVQSNSSHTTASANSLTVGWSGATTSTNLLVAVVQGNAGGTVTGITDTQLNSWSRAVGQVQNNEVDIWQALNVVGGVGSVKVSMGANMPIIVAIYEVGGAATSSAFDVGTSSVTTGATPNITSAVTNHANEVVFYGFSTRSNSLTVTGDASYNNINEASTGSTTNVVGVMGWNIVGSTGAQSAAVTWSSSTNGSAVIGTFSDTGGGGGGTTEQPELALLGVGGA